MWLLMTLVAALSAKGSLAKVSRLSNQTSPSEARQPEGELQLPPPSLLQRLYETTAAVLEATWTSDIDKEADTRQMTVNGNFVITLGTFIAALLATVFGVVGFGSVGLLAAKALSVGTLALFLTAMAAIKHHHTQHSKSDSGGQTVHFVPIQSGGSHHEYFHDRADLLPPYIAYTDKKRNLALP